mmetsp:Transcript_36345/g.91401  ORF Transcript_36345/g.91401 Transcript_36345/m.91401 type:complete len:159 (-) Transcript_36345:8-484(-)
MARGRPQDSADIGTWLPNNLTERYAAKMRKHGQAYRDIQRRFIPLIVSSYGVLHPDFLRLLWVIAAQRDTDLDVGEVREKAVGDPRHLILYKLRSRVAVAAARATASRLLGSAGGVFFRPPPHPRRAYEPSDPTFTSPVGASLTGLSIGNLPLHAPLD